MASRFRRVASATVVVLLALAAAASAQTPAPACPCPPVPPPRDWTGNAGFGLSLNRGNTDTTNMNATFEAAYDPKTKDVWKFQGLYLRGENDGDLTVARLFLQGRYERSLTPRIFAFAQAQYLHDEFKEIDYLFAPGGGIGYKVVNTDTFLWSVDGGAGVKWEKNPGLDVQTSGTINGGERLDWKVSPTARLTHTFSALWDADDFGDALYTISVALASSVTKRIELKIEVLDSNATRPPNPTLNKNDVALVTAVVYRF